MIHQSGEQKRLYVVAGDLSELPLYSVAVLQFIQEFKTGKLPKDIGDPDIIDQKNESILFHSTLIFLNYIQSKKNTYKFCHHLSFLYNESESEWLLEKAP